MSTTTWTGEEAQKALQVIVKRASMDVEFRSRILENPAGAVLEATGRPLPEGFVINVVENDGADLTVVLPDLSVASELSDDLLEAVAGGADKPYSGPKPGAKHQNQCLVNTAFRPLNPLVKVL